jgi:exodeoxyribonuclease V alpha subunit
MAGEPSAHSDTTNDRPGRAPGADSIEGTVERIVFRNEINLWTVARLRVESGDTTVKSARASPRASKDELCTIVGNLPGVATGISLRATGRWVTNDKYGPQFQVTSFSPLTPETELGIERFLGGGLVKGVGPGLAERIVKTFGLKTLEILEQNPGRLNEVSGLGRRKAKQIATAWQAQRGTRDTLIFLQGHGLSPLMASRIHRRYGTETQRTLQANPYRLMEIPGIGFRIADRIAQGFGIAKDAPIRADAGILFALEQTIAEGHVSYPRDRLCRAASEMLMLLYDRLDDAVDRLIAEGRLVQERGEAGADLVYLPELRAAEADAARALAELLREPSVPHQGALSLHAVEAELGLQLGEEQKQALALALRSKLLIVTGGPGVGKTTLVRGLLSVLERAGEVTALAAPTGRAAKRLSEATGREARTLHRLLEFSPDDGRFLRDAARPLQVDLLVVDETSMVDLPLLAHLVAALPRTARLVLVGDVDQLPSIGPGAVLRDLIASGAVPVARLTQIHRQAAQSQIVQNAHRVNQGLMPLWKDEPTGGDFYFIGRESAEAAAETVCELVAERIPKAFGIPSYDVQVLAPMHRGDAGTRHLNEALQRRLNPPAEQDASPTGARGLRLGDRVMQLRNDYQREVFNGDIGKVVGLGDRGDDNTYGLIVSFEGRELHYAPEEQDELSLAYACSVHKAQGSEYPAVVLTLLGQHYPLLRRNLLYTAMTRSKKLLVLVGSRKALAIAAKHDEAEARFSRLAEKLRAAARA